jgi:hypothetical protein
MAEQRRLKRRLSVTLSDDDEDTPSAKPSAISNKRKSIDLTADEKEKSGVTAKAKKSSQCSPCNLSCS